MKKTITAFGEIMLRLATPDKRLIKDADNFCASYGGSESNVLVALSALGNTTKFISQVPDNPLGEGVVKHLRSYNINTDFVKKQGDILGMYFVEEGFGQRASDVIYARKNAAITHLTENDFDFDEVFSNCDLFHISGISFALSESVKNLCFAFLKEAKRRNVTISFDFNYRSKLWSTDQAKELFKDVVSYTDIVFCSQKDLQVFLDIDEKEYLKKYPDTKYLVVREREVLSSDLHKVKALIYTQNGGLSKVIEKEFAVLERVGGGDAFAAGVLHSLLKNAEDLDKAIDFGVACFVLKHTVKGDILSMNEKDIYAYIDHSLKDIGR